MSNDNIREILSKLNILEKAYDIIRLIDPINKAVIDVNNNKPIIAELHCFDLWGKNRVCNNCISIKAYRDNATYIKLEYVKDEIYMITAIPVELQERRVVLELIKNATDSLIMDGNTNHQPSQIHSLIDNMNNLAFIDSLTGIYNRRYINEKLPIHVTNAAVLGRNLSVIMADIDHFKNVNDNYGHLIGDYTLQHFATILLMGVKRETDWVARYGGEEFIICLPGASKEKALEIAERIRKTVEDSVVDTGTNKFKITASFGISSMTPEHTTSMEDFIAEADDMLYQAKNKGRNRTEVK